MIFRIQFHALLMGMVFFSLNQAHAMNSIYSRIPAVMSINSMSQLLEKIPMDLSDSVCGFDIDGTLIEPSAEDFKKRVPVEKKHQKF